jgi:hypothetical protein
MNRLFTCILAVALINLAWVPSTFAQAKDETQRVARIKKNVSKIGVDAKVDVTLLDQTKLKGRIDQIGESYFVLMDKRTADSRTVTFSQVKQVKRAGDNPFGDPAVLMGIAFIPAIIGACIMARSR